MKTFLYFKSSLIVLVFFMLVSISVQSVKASENMSEYESIQDLINENKLKVIIDNVGSYQKNCIRFDLENNTSESLKILIEAGRRLSSYDTTIQDIYIVKNKIINLEPYEKKIIPGYGFCCQSSKKAPPKDSKFSIGTIPIEWLPLSKVIDENDFPSYATQQAIWVLSNDHPISSIHNKDMNKIKKLRETVAEIKGVELPWYSLSYVKDTTLFSNRPKRIIGTLNYNVKTNSMITITIRTKVGHLVTVLVKDMPRRGKQTYELDLLVKDWPKGNYEILIHEDYSNLNMKKTFIL